MKKPTKISNQNQNFSQRQFYKNIETSLYEKLLLEIKNKIEALDLEIKNSDERKSGGYKIKGYVPRTIITKFGRITFVRTKYLYYDQKNKKRRTVFLLDKYFKIEKYKKIDLTLRIAIIKELAKGKKQQAIVDQFKSAKISRMSISHLAKNINATELNKIANSKYQIPQEINQKQFIYLNIDDTFTPLRDDDKSRKLFRVRLAVAHLGYSDNPLKKELLAKRAFYIFDKIPLEKNTNDKLKIYAQQIRQKLAFFYGDISNKQIIICGDGARWIKKLSMLLNAEFVLDKYHITKELFKIFHHKKIPNEGMKNLKNLKFNLLSKSYYQECTQFLNAGDPTKIIALLSKVKTETIWANKIDKINTLINYIKYNNDGIVSYQKQYYIGSQTEAMVSHIVQSLKGYGAKIYNHKTFKNILNLRVAHLNTLDPLKAYYQKINNKIMENIHYFGSS